MLKNILFILSLVYNNTVLYAGNLSGEYQGQIKEEEDFKLHRKAILQLNKDIIDSPEKIYCNSDKERFFLGYYQADDNLPPGILISILKGKVYMCLRYDYNSCFEKDLGESVVEITNSFPSGIREITDTGIMAKWEYEYNPTDMTLLIKYIGGSHPFFKEPGVVEKLICNKSSKGANIYKKAKDSPLELIK